MFKPINITVNEGTDEATRDLVRRAVEGALSARDAEWSELLEAVVGKVIELIERRSVGTPKRRSVGTPNALPGVARAYAPRDDGHQRAAELALDVLRQALPDVFATVEKSVREATIVRAPDGQIQSVITRTIDADAA